MAGLGSYALGSLADSFGSSAASQGIDAATTQAAASNVPMTTAGAAQVIPGGAGGAASANTLLTPSVDGMLPSSVPLNAPVGAGGNPFGPAAGTVNPAALSTSTPQTLAGTQTYTPNINVSGPQSFGSFDDAGKLTLGAESQVGRTVNNLGGFRIDSGVEYDTGGLVKNVTGLKPDAAASAINKDLGQQIYRGSPYFGSDVADTAGRFEMLGEGISNIGEEGFPDTLRLPPKELLALVAWLLALAFDPEPLDYAAIPGRRIYQKPDIQPLNRAVNLEGFDAAKTGIDPQFSFFAKNGKRGGLDTIHAQTGYSDISMAQMGRPAQGQGAMTQQGTPQTAQMRSAIMKAAQEVASNANPRAATGPAPRAVGLNPNAAVNALFSSNPKRQNAGGRCSV